MGEGHNRLRMIGLVTAVGMGCGGSVPAQAHVDPDPDPEPTAPTPAPQPIVAPAGNNPFAAEGLAALELPTRLGWPTQNVHITSTFGWRVDPVSGKGTRLHRGVDFRGRRGDLALSVGAGTVTFAGHDAALGKFVTIAHNEGVTSLYGHLSDLLVHEGVHVQTGTAIGLVGNTGRSEAPHLHLSMKVDGVAVDPLLLLGQPLHRAAALAARLPTPAPAPDPAPDPDAARSDAAAPAKAVPPR